jgi:oligoendopeptidase F
VSKVEQLSRWNLKDVLPSHTGPEFESFLSELESKVRTFEGIRNALANITREELVRVLQLYSEIIEMSVRLHSYAYLMFSEDTTNQDSRSFLDRAEDIRADVDNRTLFFRLWWMNLNEQVANYLMPDDKDFSYFLKVQRKLTPYTLGEKVEQAINLKNATGFAGWTSLYDQVTSSFSFEITLGGRKRKLPQSEIAKLFFSPVSKIRESAYKSLLRKYAENGSLLGETYRIIVRDWRNEFIKLRHYKTPISPRNLENDLTDESVETLLDVCKNKAEIFQEFFKMKARIIGLKKMSRYHIYAPHIDKTKRMEYNEAVSMLIDTFSNFDRGFGELAKKIFESNHVDFSVRQGKRQGAFCIPVSPKIVPYLSLNFTGTIRDLYTMAHEVGHGVHSQLASSHSILTWEPPLVLAETASVFAELIIFDRILRQETNPALRTSVILDRLTSIYTTVGRQAFIVLFEKKAHEDVENGATVEELCKIYYDNLKEQFGESVDVPEEFKWEWTYIPHIYRTPFYCYSYAFGNLLSLSFYDRYVREGQTFVQQYKDMLSLGGSMSPEDILQNVGIDIRTRDPWEKGFEVIKKMIDELKSLNPKLEHEKDEGRESSGTS